MGLLRPGLLLPFSPGTEGCMLQAPASITLGRTLNLWVGGQLLCLHPRSS